MNIIKYTCVTSFTSFIVHRYDFSRRNHLPPETFSNQLIAIQMQKNEDIPERVYLSRGLYEEILLPHMRLFNVCYIDLGGSDSKHSRG